MQDKRSSNLLKPTFKLAKAVLTAQPVDLCKLESTKYKSSVLAFQRLELEKPSRCSIRKW